MQAAVINANGGLEVVEVGEAPEPKPASQEVLLEVKAAALNHLDIWIRKGRPGVEMAFPHVLGSDCCGVVRALGHGVKQWHEGEAVIVNPGFNGEDEWTRRGEQNISPTFGILGAHRQGTFAQYVSVPASKLMPKPAHLSDAEAAALSLAHLTAWNMLVTRAQTQPGESVLIHGIGGGVALAALQLCGIIGARAIVTSSSREKLRRAADLGAAACIDYTAEDVAAKAREATRGKGVDVVIDTTGAETWPINFAAMRRGGRAVHAGVTTGKEATVNLSALYLNHFTIMGATMGADEGYRQMVEAVNQQQLRPVMDSTFPLSEARAAMAKMESGAQFGKIALAIG